MISPERPKNQPSTSLDRRIPTGLFSGVEFSNLPVDSLDGMLENATRLEKKPGAKSDVGIEQRPGHRSREGLENLPNP